MDNVKTQLISGGDAVITLLETGDIRLIESDSLMINQLPGNYLDGMAGNLYLRVYGDQGIAAHPLLGKAGNAAVRLYKNRAEYTGAAGGFQYQVSLGITGRTWFFTVELANSGPPARIDAIYAQDIGLAAWGHIRSNEAYNAQYIDHKAFQTETGYTICSRQNQRQRTGFPFLQQGCFGKAVSFSVDGCPFYGLSYKIDNRIAGLAEPALNNRIYQYEFAYTALQSEPVVLETGASYTVVFYAVFLPHLETPIEAPLPLGEIKTRYQAAQEPMGTPITLPRISYDVTVADVYSSPEFTEPELEKRYPFRLQEERIDSGIASFFTDKAAHVVTQRKERILERSQGNIIITGKNDAIQEDTLTSTQYIYGVFNAQIALGNTSFNKIVSNCRNALNVQKIPGQRLMVRIDGRYRLLTMPAVFEMGLNYGRWLYRIQEDILEITVFTALERPLLCFTVCSYLGKSYDFLLYTQLTGGADEYSEPPAAPVKSGAQVSLRHRDDGFSAAAYPALEFVFHVDRDFILSDDRRFYPEAGSLGEGLAVFEFSNTDRFSYTLEGRIHGVGVRDLTMNFEGEREAYFQWLFDGINGFKLSLPGSVQRDCLEALNLQTLWYAHNARIHFASPHGLEQYGGAAWGTRDVCQGPFEYFLAVQRYAAARDLLLRVYAAQFEDDGSWPQWFMFDRYNGIRAGESHGDVILWPMKALADYLNASGDQDILNQILPYAVRGKAGYTAEKAPLFTHLEKQLAHIKEKRIPGTSLLKYGDGDWDDTLQPQDPALRHKMASAWTNALFFQILRSLGQALRDFKPVLGAELEGLAQEVKRDFDQYVISGGVAAGFVIFEGEGAVRYLLHPSDKDTGLSYRLLPMTRSMTAELFTPDAAKDHLNLIRQHLMHPDGVRLMNIPCRYQGGINRFFARSETAANFGREIGLQYVHAHIRFIEAMAKIGEASEAWQGLIRISPVLRHPAVKNALPCQRNCYFSSSDGCFDNRYEAMRDFENLRNGTAQVKTGWRIYSSGPGICINQVVSNLLGIRIAKDMVILDPALPRELEGLRFEYALLGKPVTFIYHIAGGSGLERISIAGRDISFTRLDNPYRLGGGFFPIAEVSPGAAIELYLSATHT
ncbi:MAG: hypothetical protein LBD29_05330 [Treponema sp.]|jgi:cellobiose phosphorylase|nr:hypothetical protein [Treponema sp.]